MPGAIALLPFTTSRRYVPSMPLYLYRRDEPGNIHFLTISCYQRLPFFGLPHIRNVVVECMAAARERLAFRWIGYVVMPEHVHWLIYPQTSGGSPVIPISSILESLKTSIGKRVKAAWRETWRASRTLGDSRLDAWATSTRSEKPIWISRGIDFNVRTYTRLRQKIDYCHNNPLRRGLCALPENWIWSSYNHFERSNVVLLRMDWDGSWPLD